MTVDSAGPPVAGAAEQAGAAGPRLDPVGVAPQARSRKAALQALPRVVRTALVLVWRASRSGFLAAATFQLVGAVMAVFFVLASALAVNALLAAERGESSPAALAPAILLIALVSAISAASSAVQAHQQRLLGEYVAATTWDRVLDVTGRLDLEFFESPRFFEQLKRIELNAISRPGMVPNALFGLVGGLLGTGGLLVALLSIEPMLVPILLLAGVPTLLLTLRAGRTEFAFIVGITPVARIRAYLRTLLFGRDAAKEVRAYGAERALRARHEAANTTYLAAMTRQVRRRQRFELAITLANALALALTLGLLLFLIAARRVSLAEAAAAVVGVRLLSSRITMVVASIGTLFESSVFLEDLERFLALASGTEAPPTGTRVPFRREIVVRDLTYTYPGSMTPAVDHVDLRIGAGEVVALVGENGSGKTTLAKLVAALYRPVEGSIHWDGVDIAGLEPADVRRSVAVIFQDFVRYQLSALENIGLGEPDEVGDEPAARAAAVRAGASEVLEALPQGYQTILSREYADGRDLSGGQWQRVALARAFRRSAPLVILDEPTSALDPRAEHALFADVRGLLQGRSALLISHRFSSVRSADRIYVMESGRIVESGRHDELMALGGLYAELFTLQAHAYL